MARGPFKGVRADMLAKLIMLIHRRAGKVFGPVLRYLLHVDQQRASPSRPTPESGDLHLAEKPLWSAAEDSRAYAEAFAQMFDGRAREAERLKRRAARAEVRRKLAERFAQEQGEGRARRGRESMRERQEQERSALTATHREQRRQVCALFRRPREIGRGPPPRGKTEPCVTPTDDYPKNTGLCILERGTTIAPIRRSVYSCRKAWIGLARATRKACMPTVAQAMISAVTPTVMK